MGRGRSLEPGETEFRSSIPHPQKTTMLPLKAVLYRGVGLRLKFDLADGMRVITARGRLMVYEPRAASISSPSRRFSPWASVRWNWQVSAAQGKVVGQSVGSDPRRKKPLPRIPRRLVLITSPNRLGGAADMLETLSPGAGRLSRYGCARVRVQGEGSVQEIGRRPGNRSIACDPPTGSRSRRFLLRSRRRQSRRPVDLQ